jgi:DeoR/GlpR family transcriptional regulator of sugar metabolism
MNSSTTEGPSIRSGTLGGQRRELILGQLRSGQAVRVTDLAAELGVSQMTIRRDLDELAELGLLQKVHGGATSVARSSNDEPGFEAKLHRNEPEKQAIAERAAQRVRPATAIGIGAGTTTWRLAQLLDNIAELVIITNSVRIAQALERPRRSDRTVILTGGVRTPSDALVGPVADRTLRTFQVDTVFLGTHGMNDSGFTSPNLAEAETNRAFAETSRELIVLADHTKWGISGLNSFGPLQRAAAVVSDRRLTSEARVRLSEVGVELALADA